MKKNYEAIVIYRKDNEVIAVDKRNNKTAKAICNPKDTFDFLTGAKLALARLDHHFKVGDIVIGNENASKQYAITKKGVKCCVVESTYRGFDGIETMRVSPLNDPKAKYTVCADCFDIYLEADTIESIGFKEGDYVVGTDSCTYPITGKGVVCKVLNTHSYTSPSGKDHMKVMVVDTSSRFRWRKYDVPPEFFTLYDKTKGEEMERNDNPIKAGDVVNVHDTGRCYSCDTKFVEDNAPDTKIIARFAFGAGLGYPEKKKLPNEFKVIVVNSDMNGVDKAIIEEPITRKVYVIGVDGLSKV